MAKLPFNEVVRFVDDYMDRDPSTRDSSPGKVFGHQLKKIGVQIQRRLFRRGKVKHVIFVEEGTRNIWYKNSFNNAGVVAMGFSLSRLTMHPNAVSMEEYARYFLDDSDPDWLERNDFELV